MRVIVACLSVSVAMGPCGCGRARAQSAAPPEITVPSADASFMATTFEAPSRPDASSATPRGPVVAPDLLGHECSEMAKSGPIPSEILCEGGSIVGFYALVDVVKGVGGGFETLFDNTVGSVAGHGSDLSVSTRDGILVVRRTTCGGCRRIIGWAFVGTLARVKDADLRTLACRLRGHARADLRNGETWRTFLSARISSTPSAECAGVIAPFH